MRGRGNDFASTNIKTVLGEDDNAAAFRCLIGQRGKLGGIGESIDSNSGRRKEIRGLAITESDRAGFVEQKDVDVAGGFDSATAHGEDVVLQQTVHAGDANGAQKAAD